MPGAGLHTCLPLPSWFEFFLTPPLYPGWETQVNVIGIWNFQERDRVKERCNSLFSQLCNQGILSHNMTILLKKKNACSITKLLSNSSAISKLLCKLHLPIIPFLFRNSDFFAKPWSAVPKEKKENPLFSSYQSSWHCVLVTPILFSLSTRW